MQTDFTASEPEFQIREANPEDFDRIESIYSRARRFMRETGNENQWINGYPSREDVIADIEARCLYVCVASNGEIAGVFFFREGNDNTYDVIYEGEWLNDEPYGVVHRLASSGIYKGVADACFRWCRDRCENIRVDTHRDNSIMQSVFRKNGFVPCGIIYIRNGSERIAFQSV